MLLYFINSQDISIYDKITLKVKRLSDFLKNLPELNFSGRFCVHYKTDARYKLTLLSNFYF